MGRRKWSPFREVGAEDAMVEVDLPPPQHRHGCYSWRCWCPELDRLITVADKHHLSPYTLEFAIQTLHLRFPCTEREGVQRTLGWIRHNTCAHCECWDRRCCVSVAEMNIALEAFLQWHIKSANRPQHQLKSTIPVAPPSCPTVFHSGCTVTSCYETKNYRSAPGPELLTVQHSGLQPVDMPQVKVLREEK